MRIAILAHLHHPICEPFLGGTEMHTAVVADELVRRGHDVTLYAKGGSRTAADLVALVDEGFVFGQAPGPDGTDRSEQILVDAVTDAIDDIRRTDVDVVLNNSLGPLPYTLLGGHPMMTVLHTPPTLEKVNAVITRPGWRPDPRHLFVSVSEFNSASWRTVLPAVTCVPNGINLDDWQDLGAAQPDLAVWAARITPEKGLHLAIEAVRAAGMRLEISGPVADRAYFDAEIAPRLSERIRYVGHVDHLGLARRLSRGCVFVSSSTWAEPFGLALVEAMACGTPVAAFATGASAEIVTTDAGALASDLSAAALARAIDVARRLDRGRVRASAQQFDARIMIDRYEKLMTTL